ncbi:MAG: PspC domain-containing protein, partial [Actinomycetota bacterium]|nr:PspC domain-containing protein [Actinomycetota bacterium]
MDETANGPGATARPPDEGGTGASTSAGDNGGVGSGSPTQDMRAGGEAAARPLLVRTSEGRWVAGVAGGLGRYLNVDPVAIRVGFVLLSFVGGIGVVAYIAAWLLIPEEGEPKSVAESLLDRARGSSLWTVALIVAAFFLALMLIQLTLWPWGPFGDAALLWAAVLIAAGIWLYRWDAEGRFSGGATRGAS